MHGMMNLGTYLNSTNQTQAQFAAEIGVTQGAVSKLCSHANPRISMETAIKIERVTRGLVPLESWPKFAALANRAPRRKRG